MKKHTFVALLSLLAGSISPSLAQPADEFSEQVIVPSVEFFVPHWFFSGQMGVAYNVGEGDFSDMLSPAAQLSAGYRWEPRFGARLAFSGWEGRNSYRNPNLNYKWNFVQASADFMADLATLFAGWEPERRFSPYAFAGLGLALSFNNDDAINAQKTTDADFRKLWCGSRLNPVVRAGVGVDCRVSDQLSVGAELNVNMLPDHWNSKRGSGNNRDWCYNLLVGVKYTLGKSYGRTEPVYEAVRQPVETAQRVEYVPVEQISFNVNVYFLLNQSSLRPSETDKLQRLLAYLREHPRAFVRLSGFADRATGTPDINMRLSEERAQAVSVFLQERGIGSHRILRIGKGDTVQPFTMPQDNRVCICYVYDPENPQPQPFEY